MDADTPCIGISLDFETLRAGYDAGRFTPVDVVVEVYRRIRARGEDFVWTHLVPEDEALARAHELTATGPASLPLYGLPFAVKDNIHVAGLPTTASCPAYRRFPEKTATVVRRLADAGAILIGKNTLDQFATGLVGVRSPGHPVNPFDPDYIPGGSSSGSAVAVSAGLASFSLGSDTGGSGRVPAALNNIVGLKPTPGIVSAAGLVYANRSFDCVPIFALTCGDAERVFDVALGADPDDPFMRSDPHLSARSTFPASGFSVGVPDEAHLTFFSDAKAERCFEHAKARVEQLGGEIVEIDFSPFAAVAPMLFNGPILAERLASLGDFLADHRDEVHPVVGNIIDQAAGYSAVDLVNEYYRLHQLKTAAYAELKRVDVLMVPTTGTIYTIKELEDDPVTLNANMGYYTYFANLLQLSAVAVPAAIREDGLPFGVCFLAGPREDRALIALGKRFHQAAGLPLGATGYPYPEPAPATLS